MSFGFCICLKSQIVCRGAKIFFWQFVRVSKRFSKKKCALLVFVFFMLEKRKKENMKKMEKENFKKAQKNSVFWVVVKKKVFFCKVVIF